jgi:hypothetical protein
MTQVPTSLVKEAPRRRCVEAAVKRMKPDELDRLLRDGDE